MKSICRFSLGKGRNVTKSIASLRLCFKINKRAKIVE